MAKNEILQNGLEAIGFQFTNTENPSIIFVSELGNLDNDLTPFQIIELERASSFNADAVFFRYFEDNRSPLPQVYIYDNLNNRFNNDYTQIHKELWSSCQIPAFIVIDETTIKIFDSRKPISIEKGNAYSKEIALINLNDISNYSSIIEKYNLEKFKNGSFWESEEAHTNYLYSKTAYNNLIEKLKILRKSYNKNIGISSRLFDYVIIISTLIKFLEENGIDNDGVNLASIFFQESVNCNSFIEVLQQNKLVDILDKLSLKFNGGIFNLSDDDKENLYQANLKSIILFFDTKIDSYNQYKFWDLYSFKHIPVELISNIYEEFLPEEDKGAVYTPHYLVNFLIDECLPIPDINNESSYNTRTIDVSCGSGIFLVNCFKRLVEKYKVEKYYKTKALPENLDINILQNILRDNIFGVDINKNAVELTKFSLQLALCEMLSPRQIWTELTFQDLGVENIIQSDFFDFISNKNFHKSFDLVIGNPPFNPPPESEGVASKKSRYFNDIIKKHGFETYQIKDSNIALLFLQLSTKLLKQDNGILCLIQPALPLLHKKDNENFRVELFSKHNVVQVIDLTTHRRVLFPSATIPTCAIFIKGSEMKSDNITHVVIRRTNPSKERLYFEIDNYDIHTIKRDKAHLNYYWKSNLFGGYRLLNLINRIQTNENFKTVKDVIGQEQKSKIKNYSILEILNRKEFPPAAIPYRYDKYFREYFDFLITFIAGTSTRQGLDRPYDTSKSDFLRLPIIKDNTLTKAEVILTKDVSKYKIEEFGKGENAATNKEIIVKYSNSIPESINNYSNIYLEALNSLYKVLNKRFLLKTFYNTPACFIMHFKYTETDYTTEIIEHNYIDLSSLINDVSQIKSIKRISYMYNKNEIFIIKPKQLRYWLKSVALLDADTTISDIIHLNFSANDL